MRVVYSLTFLTSSHLLPVSLYRSSSVLTGIAHRLASGQLSVLMCVHADPVWLSTGLVAAARLLTAVISNCCFSRASAESSCPGLLDGMMSHASGQPLYQQLASLGKPGFTLSGCTDLCFEENVLEAQHKLLGLPQIYLSVCEP